jgi:hypothetical protein
LDRQRVLGQRDRVPGLDRHDRGADLDAAGLGADQGGGGERVELVGDLRDPDRGEPGLLGPPAVGPQPLHLGRVAPPLRADHHTDAHPHASWAADENELLLRL